MKTEEPMLKTQQVYGLPVSAVGQIEEVCSEDEDELEICSDTRRKLSFQCHPAKTN